MEKKTARSNWPVVLVSLALVAVGVVCAVIWPLPTIAVVLICQVLILSSLNKSEAPVEITPEVARAIALAAAMLQEEEPGGEESGGGFAH